MAQIHPSAVVEAGAQLADDAVIGPFCFVAAGARIGAGTRLVSHVSVLGRTTIGVHNILWPQVVLGGDPQDLKYHGEDSQLVIGDHNDIRECATLHPGTANGGGVTTVGDHNLVMCYAHIGHDCRVGSHVILANAVQLAGHIHIDDHANIGGASALHHYLTVGRYAFIGGMTRVVHDVPPFMLVEGNPAAVRAVNTVGLRRHGFDPESIDRLKTAFRRLYRHAPDGDEQARQCTTQENLQQLQNAFPHDPNIRMLTTAVRASIEGTFGRYLERQRHDDRYRNPVR